MLILTRHDVEALLNMPDAIAAVEDGFRQLGLGNVVMPQRAATPVTPHNGLHLSMPAFVGGDHELGTQRHPGTLTIKIVTIYGDNQTRFGLPTIQGILLLHDALSGQLLALMDAEHLTAVRTGAASGVATRYLAHKDASTIALFGAGAQAGAQLAAMCAVRPIKQVFVLTRSGAKEADFCAQMATKLGIAVVSTRDVQTAVSKADIICTATNAATPVFDGRWVQPGAHINAIGAYTAKMRELDTTTIQRSKVFVDHHKAAQTEAGDILIPIANHEYDYAQVAGELSELINGNVMGRTNDTEITVFKSVGLAFQDAVTAARVYALAKEHGVGQLIET